MALPDRIDKNRAGWIGSKKLLKCRWCEGPIQPPRRSFCSNECVSEHKIRTQPQYARRQVEIRDKGICSVCHVDTDRIDRLIKYLKWRDQQAHRQAYYPDGRWDWLIPQHQRDRLFWAYCLLAGWLGGSWAANFLKNGRPGMVPHLWEMDHILPVAEGGGSCGLENLRTLCGPCHLRATLALRARLRAK